MRRSRRFALCQLVWLLPFLGCVGGGAKRPEAEIFFNGWSSTTIAANDVESVRESPSMYVRITHGPMLSDFRRALDEASDGEADRPFGSTILLVVDFRDRDGTTTTYFGTRFDFCKVGSSCRDLDEQFGRRFGCAMSELGGVPCERITERKEMGQ